MKKITVLNTCNKKDIQEIYNHFQTEEYDNILREDWLLHENNEDVERFKRMNASEKEQFAINESHKLAMEQLQLHPLVFIEYYGMEIAENAFDEYLEQLTDFTEI